MVQRSSTGTAGVWLTVLVCGLGYFVDIYDLILFHIVRRESLLDIGVTPEGMIDASSFILNAQMVGMLLGGMIFGIMADRKGRLSVLLGSILLYSVMNIANAFVTTVEMYALARFLSGIGLAGELGVAITLVSEIMPKHSRGYGTTVVASLGILGAVGAYAVHELTSWKTAYIIGGVLGLLLLLLRVSIGESTMFKAAEGRNNISRGNMLMLFTGKRIIRYLASIAVGVPIWYVIGILVAFAPEFTVASGGDGTVSAGTAVMWAYVGLAAGDLLSGLASQALRSRKKAILLFLVLTAAAITWYLATPDKSATITYVMCGVLGGCVGYWAVFVTTAAEQFGTNLRATAATTVPNVVRGSLVPALWLFNTLRNQQAENLLYAAAVVGAVTIVIGVLGWLALRETYGQDLDYVEEW